jgi:ABC-type proline/glycine betaine transport system permease subunit
MVATFPICKELGGAWTKEMETEELVIVTIAVTVLVGSAVGVAVIVTVPPEGIEGGAV